MSTTQCSGCKFQIPPPHRKPVLWLHRPKANVPIPDSLIQLIQKEFPNRQGYVLAAVNEKYIEPRTMQKYFHYVQKQCGLVPVNFHALRHTFATRCIELGFDVKSLSEILGHATVNITLNRYVHPSMELKQQNMQKLSCLLTVI